METIIMATAQMMGFLNRFFCEYGIEFAMEGELSDLKGLVNPESHSDIDIELLTELDDPVSRLMIHSVFEVDDAARAFFVINSIEETEALSDIRGGMLANDVYEKFAISIAPFETYEQTILNIALAYQATTFCLYIMALLLSTGSINVECDTFESYLEERPDEKDMASLNMDNPNVKLLCDLIESRMFGKWELYDLYNKYN